MKFLPYLLTIVSFLPINSSIAQLCSPNLTPEQAFLALKSPPQHAGVTPLTAPQLINLNTASEAQLTQLEGIGAKKAQAIILYREMMHSFSSVDELANVKGIGQATVEKNRSRLTVH